MLKIPRPSEKAFWNVVVDYILMACLPTILLWAAASNFQHSSRDPIITFTGIVLIASASIASLRWLLTKEKTVLQTQVSAGVGGTGEPAGAD